ncbi:MAG: helix-turn-helix transcriptional regulator, partial [Clostridia bacterium]|nr:helix-turn-helix transcriptional regulator [Clostridia bacterium]
EGALDQISMLRQMLVNGIHGEINIALSDVFNGWDQISSAYTQTHFIFASLPDPSLPGIWQTADLTSTKQFLPLNYQDMASLYSLITSGNAEACIVLLDQCAERMKDMDVEVARHIFNQIRDLLAYVRLENPVLLKDLSLAKFDPKQGIAPLQDSITEICARLSVEKEDALKRYADSVLEYVNEHIYDKNLYLQNAADHFGISAPTLQKLMRIGTQTTFASYIEEKRLSHAFDLLLANHSVSDVSNECGFASVNTFYKAFRRKYGIPPQKASKEV